MEWSGLEKRGGERRGEERRGEERSGKILFDEDWGKGNSGVEGAKFYGVQWTKTARSGGKRNGVAWWEMK